MSLRDDYLTNIKNAFRSGSKSIAVEVQTKDEEDWLVEQCELARYAKVERLGALAYADRSLQRFGVSVTK